MRILHIIGKMDRAGAETMLMNLYRHMDRDKIQFDFMTFTDEVGDYDSEIEELGGKIIPIIANNPIKRMIKIRNFLVKQPEYEIVHAHMLLGNALHLIAAKKAGIKNLISHSHNTSNGNSSTLKKLYEKWSLKVNRNLPTYKIACNELSAMYLFGSTNNVLILPNAIDLEKVSNEASSLNNYFIKNFKDNGLKIIQVGRLNEVKNHKFSIRIAEELRNRNVDFTIYIIGQGNLLSNLKSEVQNKLLDDYVKFLGVRENICELMSSADFMIMPSLYEGFPVVLVESQAVGLVTIVSDKVALDVDLGLDLIEFLPILSPVEWADRLLEQKSHNYSKLDIKNKLRSSGFDVSTNAKVLSKTYMQLSLN